MEALAEGITPIVSFWESEDMLWMDGKGKDGKGPCLRDLRVPCPESVSFSDFSVEDLPREPGEPGASPTPSPPDNQNLIFVTTTLLVVGVSVAALTSWLCQRRRQSPLLGAE